MIKDYTPVLESEFGKVGSEKWEKSIEEAQAFYTGQLLRDTRKEAHKTQVELAKK